MSNEIKLNATEAIEAAKFFAKCDGKIEGFRLGMENAKQMFVQGLIEARQPVVDGPRDHAPADAL